MDIKLYSITFKVAVGWYGAMNLWLYVLGMIVFFIPSWGLLDVLRHCQADRIPFATSLTQNPTNATDLLFGDAPLVPWTDITHVNYTNPDDPTPPPYTLYTGLTARRTYFVFLSIWLMQIVCIWLKNFCTSKPFMTLSYFDQIFHSFQSVIAPTPSVDWVSGEGNCSEKYNRMKMAMREVVGTIAINSVFHAIRLIPMIYLGE